jgi:hypothetical protein
MDFAQDKTLLLKRKNLRQRNQQRRRNKFFSNLQSFKSLTKFLFIRADFSPLFFGDYLAFAET